MKFSNLPAHSATEIAGGARPFALGRRLGPNRPAKDPRSPAMPQHFVCLTFDHDNASPMIARDMTTPTMISRGDFGMVAAERLLALLGKHSIASTWFIPGHTIETYPASVAAVHAAGHEIGHHGWTHRAPASLSREEEEREL